MFPVNFFFGKRNYSMFYIINPIKKPYFESNRNTVHNKVVTQQGFEPWTPSLKGTCSTS